MGALNQRAIARMEPASSRSSTGLLDRHRRARRRVDLIDDFAAQIPVEVIGNLLDVPHATSAGRCARWSLAILSALEPVPSTEVLDARQRAPCASFCDYLRTLVAERRAHPATRRATC